MVDARTKKKVEAFRQSTEFAKHKEGIKREQVTIDMTVPGDLVVRQSEAVTVEAQFQDSDARYDFLAKATEQVDEASDRVTQGLDKVKQTFDKLLDPNTTIEDLTQICGAMTYEQLQSHKLQIELIKNNQEYKLLEQQVRSTQIRIEKNNAMLLLEQFEAQIAIARKANKVATDQDNLYHEVDLRGLNQEKNANDLTHVQGTNQLRKDDQEDYRSYKRQVNAQQTKIREQSVRAWVAMAKIAVHNADKKVSLSDRLTANSNGGAA